MKTLLTLSILLTGFTAIDQKPEIFSTQNGAIGGYDPVAYFADSEAKEGSDEFFFEWKGATWYFVSQENRDAFADDPDFYAPQYGGYCAYAVANGYTAKIDPEAWTIVDNKLYLNYNQKVQGLWNDDQSKFINSGDANWPKVLEKN